jgi:RNA polymerase sigma factor (TIGR02999 family)
MTLNSSRVRLDEILPMVYEDLRRYASGALRREPTDHAMQTTDLVHEAFLRLANINQIQWADKDHLMRAAVGAMRRVLIDYARARKTQKRDPGRMAAAPSGGFEGVAGTAPQIDLLALDEAITKLQSFDPRKAEIIELRFFGGQEIESVARILKVSPTTVKRDWTLAKAWLARELGRDPEP